MTEEHLCKHNNYHCNTCEIKFLKLTIEELEQQNEQLIEALKRERDEAVKWDMPLTVKRIDTALQQIQGKDEES